MKKITIFLIISLLILSACGKTAVFDDDGEHWDFYQPCVPELDSIPGFLTKEYATDEEWEAWTEKYENMQDCRKVTDYPTVYTFIKDFNVADEDLIKLYSEYDILSEQDMQILLTHDEAKITEHFATDCAIVIGDCIYPPEWIYEHSADDYIDAGITPEILEEKLDEYADLGLSKSAEERLYEKLSEYVGHKINTADEPCISIGRKEYSAAWLSSHDLANYEEAGITAKDVKEFLSEYGDEINDDEKDWIESCLERME